MTLEWVLIIMSLPFNLPNFMQFRHHRLDSLYWHLPSSCAMTSNALGVPRRTVLSFLHHKFYINFKDENKRFSPMLTKFFLTKFSYKIDYSPKLQNLTQYLFLGGEFWQTHYWITSSSYILHACKISRKLKINNYVTNKLFKLQVFVV